MKVDDKEIKKVWTWTRTPQGYWRPATGDVIQFYRAMIAYWRMDSGWLIQGHPGNCYYLNAMRYW